ncbi:MAG: protein translocase subunit SecF [Streptococcus sp.]|uniref:protein translocase subunit SecF n=1 Tax=Streptococcus sp. TaxID=1306 RepID=UPI0025877A32|nr:protein translocase subunit SecF [Streptococcus sp.]MCR5052605.1 protein translocase subunit SecF [Streptococcus sp.]
MKLELNIVKYRVLCLCISALLIIPCFGAMIYSSIVSPTHTPVKVSIDYTGGTILQYGVKEDVSVDRLGKLRSKLAKEGIENAEIQIINVNSDKNSAIKSLISIRTKFIENGSDTDAKITKVVQSEFKDAQVDQVSSVGPTLGKELFANSLLAVGLALLGIICYLSFRFQFDYALAAILGLVHDVIFVCGTFSILGLVCGIEVDALFVTAVLTVIGFSVHDTIVVFDRVRENLRYYSKKMSFSEIINFSVNQTLARSINTSVTTLITLFALYLFGGVTTKNFVLAMILGIAIGTYSSIFFCTVLVDIWNEKKYAGLSSNK